ncbi:DUF6035 family protein [Brumimicrobium oceani]|nr:DUF6035 family protein [Brumimicrobium oceani]
MIRAIENAFCLDTNKVFCISEHTDSQKERFELRNSVQTGKREFNCLECEQKLNVAVSRRDIIYFKHYPNSEDCALKNASKEMIKSFNEFYSAKESPRHIFLKNEIGKKLHGNKNVTSVHIDDKFIMIGGQKRRPDVYCKFKNYEIAFEIQLSNLSLNYMSSRHKFYKENGIYLIWILDNFDPDKNSQLERDIKYLNAYQNFFKLKEREAELRLICKYKKSYIGYYKKVMDKWTEEHVTLEELSFNEEDCEVYFKDYAKNRIDLEQQLKIEKEAEKIKQEKEQQIRVRKKAEHLVSGIIKEIGHIESIGGVNYEPVEKRITSLNKLEINVLNEKLGISDKPAIAQWLKKLKSYPFLVFILRCKEIDLNVNLPFGDESCFKIMKLNKFPNRENIMKWLLKRGCILTDEDKKSYADEDEMYEIWVYKMAEKIKVDTEIDMLFDYKNKRLVFIIESIKQGKILNSGLNNWIAFGNNLIQYYYEYWEYIENALKHYGIWEIIIKADSKGTFDNKLKILRLDYPKQRVSFRVVFDKLYPELK